MDLNNFTPHQIKAMENIVERVKNKKSVDDILFNPPSNEKESAKHQYKFWETQPLRKENIDGGILNEKFEQDMPEPHDKFEFCEPKTKDVYKLLKHHYSEDNTSKIHPYYSREYIDHILSIGFGLGISAKDKLVGFIYCSIDKLNINHTVHKVGNINYLCVHTKLRTLGLAELLIKGITFMAQQSDIKIGMFTTERFLPKPYMTTKWHYRPLNIKRLLDIGFVEVKKEDKEILPLYYDIPKTNKKYKLLKRDDLESVLHLIQNYNKKYNIHYEDDIDSLQRRFIDNPNINSYVIYNDDDEPIDMISLFIRDMSVRGKENIKECGLYYYTSNITTSLSIVKIGLNIAKHLECDIFSILDIMENSSAIMDLQFDPSNHNIYYYMYNYNCSDMSPYQISITSF